MMSDIYFLLIVVTFATGCNKTDGTSTDRNLPNIIYILADDLGYGDVSAFNPNGKLYTTHLDKLAADGMMFTDAHSGSSVCTPTRYGILTGRYAWRSSLKKGVTWSWDEPIISTGRTTVASFLKSEGYETACIGKWHLGLGWSRDTMGNVELTAPIAGGPLELGFDYFFGIAASLDIPPYIYIENDRSTSQQIDTIEERLGKEFWREGQIGHDFRHEEVLPMLTEKALEYIDKHANGTAPMFIYFPLPAPHTPILPTDDFKGKSQTNSYGDFVIMVDEVVGQIMSKLDEHEILDNTLLIFTSDNGCSPMADFEELASFDHNPSHIYRGHKADIYEGGHRVPFIAHWPDKIAGGKVVDETICLTDLLATCASIVGDTLEGNEGEDSYDMTPLFLNDQKEFPFREATVHHSVNGSFAIREKNWKMIFCPGSGGWSEPRPEEAKSQNLPPLQLYDLDQDVGEVDNLASDSTIVVEELTSLMEKYISAGRSTPGPAQQNHGDVFLNPELYQ